MSSWWLSCDSTLVPLGSNLSSSRVPVLEGRWAVSFIVLIINVALLQSLVYSFNCELIEYHNGDNRFTNHVLQNSVIVFLWSVV